MVFDAKPFRTDDGGLDFERILNNYEWSFETVPRYQAAHRRGCPFLTIPVWVDDPSFNVALPHQANRPASTRRRACVQASLRLPAGAAARHGETALGSLGRRRACRAMNSRS